MKPFPVGCLALAGALLAGTVPGAAATAGGAPWWQPRYRSGDYAAGRVLSILPPGENGLVNPAQAARYEATGARPPGSQDQLAKYANLLFGYPRLTDRRLANYYDDESLGVPKQDITKVEHPSATVPVVIYRDRHQVPHIYGANTVAVAFGAGYAAAQDRLFLMDVLRHYGEGTLSEFLGPSCQFEQMDHDQLLTAPYTAAQAQAQINAKAAQYGALGRQLQRMLSAYVAGINTYVRQTRHNPRLLPADYSAALQPPLPWKPTDVIYIAALIGGIFGKGGGNELGNAALVQYLQRRFGHSAAATIFRDFKEQNDPAAPTTIVDRRFPYEIPGRVNPATVAMPDNAAAPLHGGPTDTTPGCDLTNPNPTATRIIGALHALPKQMSNALVVGAGHSANGHPLAVFGPQVSYYAPQILMEEELHAPDYVAEGAAFPGTNFLVELGRGPDFAWSATSAGSDNVDERLELICNPHGGRPASQGKYYEFRGRCLPMLAEDFREVAVPKPGGPGAPTVINHHIYLTRHGIVQGWTTADGGRPVAVVIQRSTYNHEADSAIGFLRWNTPSLTDNVQSWMTGAEAIGYTFNWFYVDNRDIGYYQSGWDPIRPWDVDPNLPTWGTGVAEWQGFLGASAHPHEIDPRQGFFDNWNNKPAPGFSAADDNYAYGPVYRVLSLTEEIHRQFARHAGRITRADLVQAMETAATVDLDGRQVLPLLLRYLAGHPASAGVRAMLTQLRNWYAAGAQRIKASPGATQYRNAAAVAIMDELTPRLIRALFDPLFAAGGVYRYDGMSAGYTKVPMEFTNTPDGDGAHLGSAYDGGWEGYLVKLLRELDGLPAAQPFSRATTDRVCGGGLTGCRAAVTRALGSTYRALLAANGGNPRVASWTQDTATSQAGVSLPQYDQIEFSTVGIVGQPPIEWQNRPTFQQVVQFPGHRPR
jgi:acyl-homoserine lactone acylase PvdQ